VTPPAAPPGTVGGQNARQTPTDPQRPSTPQDQVFAEMTEDGSGKEDPFLKEMGVTS